MLSLFLRYKLDAHDTLNELQKDKNKTRHVLNPMWDHISCSSTEMVSLEPADYTGRNAF